VKHLGHEKRCTVLPLLPRALWLALVKQACMCKETVTVAVGRSQWDNTIKV